MIKKFLRAYHIRASHVRVSNQSLQYVMLTYYGDTGATIDTTRSHEAITQENTKHKVQKVFILRLMQFTHHEEQNGLHPILSQIQQWHLPRP